MVGATGLSADHAAGCMSGWAGGLDYLRRIQAASERIDQSITDAPDYTRVARQECY
jgi:hypothetical protein